MMLQDDADLRTLLQATRTIAVVGLSDDPSRDSYQIARGLQERGFAIIPVNPNASSVLGCPSMPDLRSIAQPVDLVNVFRRPEFVPAIVEDAIAIGARALWLQLGVVHPAAAERAAAAGLSVVMDRCILVEYRRLRIG